MFTIAANKHFGWASQVGVGNAKKFYKFFWHGMGCVLDDRHVLTARHVLNATNENGSYPMVIRSDGVFKCEVAFESALYDIAILRHVNQLNDEPTGKQFPEYPTISNFKPFLGSSVAFMSRLKIGKDFGEDRPHLAVGFISMFLPGEDSYKYILSSTVMQQGFSGSVVFRPDSEIVGVIIQSFTIQADADGISPIYKLPVMSPIEPLTEQIKAVLAQ